MRIFISYRHSDAIAGTALLLRDRLAAFHGKDRVFLDNASLPVADSFPEHLERELHSCDVFLALIDSHWRASIPRLHDPQDWVRREIEVALQRRASGLRLIPVMLDGATMPKADSLPTALATLADLQAPHPLRSVALSHDIANLKLIIDGWTLDELEKWLIARRRAAWRAVAGAVLLGIGAVLALFDLFTVDTRLEALTLSAADLLADVQPHPDLALVVIDEQTEQALGKPYMLPTQSTAGPALRPEYSWRSNHAELIDKLSAAGARVVAFDILLARPSPEHDPALLSAALTASERGTTVIFGSPRVGEVPPLPPPAVQTALLCIGNTLDWARTVPLVVRRTGQPPAAHPDGAGGGGGVHLTALSQLAALPSAQAQVFDSPNDQVVVQGVSAAAQFIPVSRFEGVTEEQPCGGMAPGDEVAQLYIRFSPLTQLRDPARRFRYEDLVGPGAALDHQTWLGKTVLVGVAQISAGALDQRPVLRALVPEVRQGFEVQADAINTVLQQVGIQRAPAWAQAAVLLGMAGLGMAGRFWRRLWVPRLGPLFCAGAAVAYLAVTILMCAELDLLFVSSYPLAAMLMAYFLSSAMLRQQGFWLPGQTR